MRDMDGPRRIDVGFQDRLPVLAVRRVSLELACPPNDAARVCGVYTVTIRHADVVANAQGVTVPRFAAV